jgi:hypothetical protein
MTAEFDTVSTYAAGGDVLHRRYINLCFHFISIIVIQFIVYIIILCVGFLSATVLWTAEVIVGSRLPVLGLIGRSEHLHRRKS